MSVAEHLNVLGKPVRDRVTGLSGVATSVCFDLYGCVQIVIVPKAKEDGELRTGNWFDVSRVEVLSDQPTMAPVPAWDYANKGPEVKPLPN